VLGASNSNVLLLLSRDFTRWVLIANGIAWPIAYLGLERMLQMYAYKIPMGFDLFILSGLLTLFISWITISVQSWKAASANPVDIIRYE
jgi:putative ABC transport system permease protein